MRHHFLYTGEKLGNKKGPELDIAVDPLEGTNFAANNFTWCDICYCCF